MNERHTFVLKISWYNMPDKYSVARDLVERKIDLYFASAFDNGTYK